MKKIFIIVLILAAAAGAYYWSVNRSPKEPAEVLGTYKDAGLPFSFEYREDPEGYIVQAVPANGSVPELLKTIVVMQKADYDSIQRGEREGGEGPPTITVNIFSNANDLTPERWVTVHANHNNSPLMIGETTKTTVAGTPAVAYDADGLYPNKNVVFAHGDAMYYISGSYLEKNSSLYRDFPRFLESIKLSK